jgi:hypothetical protein
LVALIAICKRSESALLILGTLAGIIQLLDAGIGLLQHDFSRASRYCRIPVLRGVSANYVCAKPHIIVLFVNYDIAGAADGFTVLPSAQLLRDCLAKSAMLPS